MCYNSHTTTKTIITWRFFPPFVILTEEIFKSHIISLRQLSPTSSVPIETLMGLKFLGFGEIEITLMGEQKDVYELTLTHGEHVWTTQKPLFFSTDEWNANGTIQCCPPSLHTYIKVGDMINNYWSIKCNAPTHSTTYVQES